MDCGLDDILKPLFLYAALMSFSVRSPDKPKRLMLPEYSFFRSRPCGLLESGREPFPTNKFIIPSNDGYGIILMLYIVKIT
nr:hypothetical protein [Escherichia coli]UPG28645.1 hypothetical protein J4W10_000095 [Escherichia coli]